MNFQLLAKKSKLWFITADVWSGAVGGKYGKSRLLTCKFVETSVSLSQMQHLTVVWSAHSFTVSEESTDH